MTFLEVLYFLEFEDVDNELLLQKIINFCESKNLKTRKNIALQRLHITPQNKIYDEGMQLLIYDDVLKTYEQLAQDPIGKYHFKNIKKICKQFPPTKKAISLSYIDQENPCVNEFVMLDLFIKDEFSLWLRQKAYVR